MDFRVLVTGAATSSGRSMLEALRSESVELLVCDGEASQRELETLGAERTFQVHRSDGPEFVGDLVTLCVQHDVDVIVPMRESDQVALARVPRIFERLGSPVWLAQIPAHATYSHARRILHLAERSRSRASVGEWLRRISGLAGAESSAHL